MLSCALAQLTADFCCHLMVCPVAAMALGASHLVAYHGDFIALIGGTKMADAAAF